MTPLPPEETFLYLLIMASGMFLFLLVGFAIGHYLGRDKGWKKKL